MPKLVRLPDAAVRKIRTPGRHSVDSSVGLYLLVPEVGTRKFLARVKVAGRRTWATIGPADRMTLAEARNRAAAASIEAPESGAHGKVKTFRQAAEAFISLKRSGWRAGGKSERQWQATLETYAFPLLGDLRCDEILPDHVARALKAIWIGRPETADRVRQRIGAIVMAELRRLRIHLPDPTDREDLRRILPARRKVVRHHPAPTLADLSGLLDSLGSHPTHRALRWVALTACRSGEAVGMTWGELDGDIWTVPAERMKAAREWRVPITSAAASALPADNPRIPDAYVFPNREGGRLSDMALTMLVRKRGGTWVPHGIRAAFKSWATEQGFSHPAVELSLAHTPSKLEAAYQRSELLEQRRELLTAWSVALDQNA